MVAIFAVQVGVNSKFEAGVRAVNGDRQIVNREIGLASEGRDHGMKTARDSMQWEIRKEKKIEAGVTS